MLKKSSYIQRWIWLDILLAVALFLFGVFFYNQAQDTLPQSLNWHEFIKYIGWHDEQGWHMGLLLKGLAATIRLGIWSGLLALIVGLVVGTRLAAKPKCPFSRTIYIFVVFLRNTPPLILLFLLYFLTSDSTLSFFTNIVRDAPQNVQNFIGFIFATPDNMDRMLAAVITLGCYQGAYVAEIVRAGLESLPRGQWDAAAALGFKPRDQFCKVLLPQCLPLMIPALAGQYVSIFKDSALAALISVPELTFQGMEIVAITRLPFETWILVAILYLMLSLICTNVFHWMERRLHWYKPFI